MKKMVMVFFIIIFLNSLIDLYAQDSVQNIAEMLGEDLLDTLRYLDKNRRIEQSEILNYDNLPGTFWVVVEPYIINGDRYFFQGYVFLNKNCILEVAVVHSPTMNALEALSILPVLYITQILSAMTYKIIDGKIMIFDEVFCYLEDTYLYFNRNNEYRKYRLESRFSIHMADTQG